MKRKPTPQELQARLRKAGYPVSLGSELPPPNSQQARQGEGTPQDGSRVVQRPERGRSDSGANTGHARE
jgi:hypothetical protein